MNDIKYGRKRSGIRRQLKHKINEWLESIDDEATREMARKNVIVTGGSIASMLLGEPVNDYDIYFKNKLATEIIAKYYVEKFIKLNKKKMKKTCNGYLPEVRLETLLNCKGKPEERVVIFLKSAGVIAENQEEYHYFESLSEDATIDFAESLMKEMAAEADSRGTYRPVFMSQNAITLSDKMQIVIRFYGKPQEIHDNYDFLHATCWYDHSKDELYFPPAAMECLLSRTLIYHGSLYPVASIFRMKKFIQRGWRITAGQQLKIMWQISELNLRDMSTLREQLTGVDMAYMYQLIQAISSVDLEKINSTYIAEIIDRIFD